MAVKRALFAAFFVAMVLGALATEKKDSKRNPRLFFVTTSTSTTSSTTVTTISATTICVTYNAGVTCPAKKKKRWVSEDPITDDKIDIDRLSISGRTQGQDSQAKQLAGSEATLVDKSGVTKSSNRDAKFFFVSQQPNTSSYGLGAFAWYYMTTTSTSTSLSTSTVTSITATVSLSVACTPSGSPFNLCG